MKAQGTSKRVAAARLVAQMLGLGLIQAWTYIVFFSNLIHYSQPTGYEHLGILYGYWCTGIVATSVAGVVAWHLATREKAAGEARPEIPGASARRDGPRRKRARIETGLSVAGTLVLSTATWVLVNTGGNKAFERVCFATSFVAGMAICIVFWRWAASYVSSLDRYIAARIGAASMLGAGLYVLAHHLPAPGAHAMAVLLPLLSLACLRLCRSSAGTMAQARTPTRHGTGVFVRASVAVLLVGFAESFARAVFQSPDVVGDSPRYQWVLLASALVAGTLITCIARFRPGKDTVGRVNHALMLVMIITHLVSPAVYGFGYAADVSTLVCFFLFYLFVWTTLVQVSAFYHLSHYLTFGIGLGTAYLSCLLGNAAGTCLSPLALESYRIQIFLSLGCALLTLVAMLFVANERTFVELLDADDESPSAPRRFALRCEAAAQAYGLTPKEAAVMTLVAKGRSSQRIQEILGVSASTVNTHVNHIYRKMGVHGRQEMLDLLERGEDPAQGPV